MTDTSVVNEVDDILFSGEEEAPSPPDADDVISLDDAVSLLGVLIDEACDFIGSAMMPHWEEAEKYYDGKTNLPTIKGRSRATDTAVRDAVRAVKTSVLRSLVSEREVVRYTTTQPELAQLADLQTDYAADLFWSNDGYAALVDVVQDALLKKVGIMSVKWVQDYEVTHLTAQSIDAATLEELRNNPSVSVTQTELIPNLAMQLYNANFTYLQPKGRIHIEHIPLYEFFISESATSIKDARVVGRRRSVHVGDAIAMGLEYDDWSELDDLDVEDYDATGESVLRRGYSKDRVEDTHESDPSMRRILLTEVYARFDLDGTGVPQLYCFYLGGTNYVLLSHEKVHDIPIHSYCADPQPAAFFGKSLFDIMQETQDVGTSLLRATVDNAHLSNNRRLAVHETMVNVSDVLSSEIGAPIRVRAPGMIQEIGTQPTIGSMLPLLQYLNQRGEVKSGVTSAALGLDPNAMQSTDKDAVRNTIELAKGQVNYYARNLAETGFKETFRHLLKISILNFDEIINFRGIEVPQEILQPDMPIQPAVGLGNADRMERIMFLDSLIQYQMQAFMQLGLANPVVTLEQHYNAMADKAKLMGFPDLSRYMNLVDPQTTQQFMEELIQRQQPPPPPDPTEGMIEVEKIKSQAALQEAQLKAQAEAAKAEFEATLEMQKQEAQRDATEEQIRVRMTEILMDDDLKRDEMLQKLYIEAAKLNNETLAREAQAEQKATKPQQPSQSRSTS